MFLRVLVHLWKGEGEGEGHGEGHGQRNGWLQTQSEEEEEV